MLNANKQELGKELLVTLEGTIEEHVNFDQLIGPFEGTLTLHCKGITRINSVGVRTWIRYFQGLKQQGKTFRFVECSHPLIEQLNMVSNFACGGEVVSILLPYLCLKCHREFSIICSTQELKGNHLKVPTAKCEKDQSVAQFDDDPQEYLYFLED